MDWILQSFLSVSNATSSNSIYIINNLNSAITKKNATEQINRRVQNNATNDEQLPISLTNPFQYEKA